MKSKTGLVILLMLFMIIQMAVAGEPYNYAQLWRSLDVVAREMYINGVVDGIGEAYVVTMQTIAPEKLVKTPMPVEVNITEVDNQLNRLVELKKKYYFTEPSTKASDYLFGTVTTDIHMKLMNGSMSNKIKAKSKVLIMDYLPDRKSFKIEYGGEVGYLSDSWINQTSEITEFKNNKAAVSRFMSVDEKVETKTIVHGILRSRPKVSSAAIVAIPTGSKVIVFNWYQKPYFKISYDNRIGYLSYGSIKLVGLLTTIVENGKPREVYGTSKTQKNLNKLGINAGTERAKELPTEKSKQTLSAPGMQKVEYLSDSIAEKEGKYIRLLGGSDWVLSSSTLALVTDDIIIVFKEVDLKDKTGAKLSVAYVDGDVHAAKHVGGMYVSQTGYLTTVVEALGDGAILKLAGGSLLSIPQYDQYDTGWWLPPYEALLTADKMYLWNLKKGKRVWVNPR